MHTDFVVDPVFRDAILPLLPEEKALLEENIIQFGCRDPLVVWEGILLDGHHRFEICSRLNIPFSIVTITLKDRESALDWMDANQLGRRNLTPDAFKLLLGRRYNRVKKAHGGDRKSSAQIEPLIDGEKTADRLAVEHGVSAATVKRAGAFAAEVEKSPEIQQAIADRQPLRQIKAAQRREERVEKIQEISRGNTNLSSSARFPIILADPPWRYEHIETESRAIENQYPTMSLDDICAMPISEIATPDAVLFMWTTSPKLAESLAVVSAWGFEYRTCAVWDKERIGMGYYFRQQHELLLVAVRGNLPCPETQNRPSSVIREARGKHSAKPEKAYEIIEAMYPEFPKIELFCRSPRSGWSVWGNQSDAA